MKKHQTTTIVLILLAIGVGVYFIFFHKKGTESSWAPTYRDPKKELQALRGGMANEGDSVAGMIANPEIGAMVHHKKKHPDYKINLPI
jgi:hypothetical protein